MSDAELAVSPTCKHGACSNAWILDGLCADHVPVSTVWNLFFREQSRADSLQAQRSHRSSADYERHKADRERIDLLEQELAMTRSSQDRDRALSIATRCVDLEDAKQRLESELATRTAALRELQKERDPQRLAAAVAEAREQGRRIAFDEIAKLRAKNESLRQQVEELARAKRRLREALERTKSVPRP